MKQCRKLKNTKQRKPSASARAALCEREREGKIERKEMYVVRVFPGNSMAMHILEA